jgi:tetratricopeptide (TPR) repeat protein
MRTFPWSKLFDTTLKTGSLALVIALPSMAAEPSLSVGTTASERTTSSVGFVDRETIGWRNPLRASSATESEIEESNPLRQTVTQVSYEEEIAAARSRTAQDLQRRQQSEPAGVFSAVFGGAQKSTAGQPQFRSAGKTGPSSVKDSTSSAFRYMPTFKTSAARQQTQASANRSNTTNARAGSGAAHVTQAPTQRTATRAGSQPTYNSAAAAAQAYQRQSGPPKTAATSRQPQTAARPSPSTEPRPTNTPLSRPTIATKPQARVAPVTPPKPTESPDPSTPAGILMRAHQLSSMARTEDEFSKVLSLCKQVPARTATPEETAFGRQLAAWSLNRRGQLKARGRNNEAAMADFEQAIRIDGECWRALHNRGVLLAQAGQFEPAFDDFHKTIELNPGFAKAYANRGALYVLAGELEPALADYQRALDLDPKLSIAERGCGRVCHMLGQVDESFDHLSRAIELAPRDANARASRADLLTDLGEYAAAAHDYDDALSINPRYADAYRGSAWLLATCPDDALRNPKLALERAQQATELDRKSDATTFDTLAAAQASAGDFRAAAESIRRAIELAPPSERSVYQDRMQLYRQSMPYRIAPVHPVQQAAFEQ